MGVFIVVLGVLFMMSKAIAKPNTEAGDLDSIYQDIAHAHGDDWRLAKVFAMKESSENPNAENPRDPSYGLFGIQSLWLVHFRFLDNDDPELESKAKELLKNPRIATEMFFRILAYFRGRTNPQTLQNFRFPAEADIYNVGETLWSQGIRNVAYRDFINREYREITQAVDA